MSRPPGAAWSETGPAPPLPAGEIHIWRIPLDASPQDAHTMRTCLSEDERDRAARFHFEIDRSRFTAAHCGLRTLLGRYLDTEGYREPFHAGANGKPALARGAALRFNLAHSKGLALVAVAAEREIGVDLEAIDQRIELESVARRFFSAEEYRRLLGLSSARRLEAFFHIWSQKEAYLKGRGDGVALGLDHFDVEADPGAPAALLADRRDPEAPSRWTLYSIDPGAGFRGALAVEGARPVLRRFGWE